MMMALMLLLLPMNVSADDLSSLYFDLTDGRPHAAVHLLVTDPQGRRVGQSPAGSVVREIPGASYGADSISTEEGSDDGPEGAVFFLEAPIRGAYTITLSADATATYRLSMHFKNKNGVFVTSNAVVQASINPGELQILRFQFDPDSSSSVVLKPDIDLTATLPRKVSACSAVSMSGNSQIYGDVQVGGRLALGGNARIEGNASGAPLIQGGHSSIVGTVSISSESFRCALIDNGFVETVLGAGSDNDLIPDGHLVDGVLRVAAGEAVDLPAGNYMVNALTISGNGKLRAQGKVNVVVRERISLDGGAEIGAIGHPVDILLFASDGSLITLGRSLFGNLFAPKVGIVIAGEANVAGRVEVGRVEMSGTSRIGVP